MKDNVKSNVKDLEVLELQRQIGGELVRGYVAAAMWSAILDNRVCPVCAQLDGQILSVDDPLYGTWQPPLHPACRCLLFFITDQTRPENRQPNFKPPGADMIEKYAPFKVPPEAPQFDDFGILIIDVPTKKKKKEKA